MNVEQLLGAEADSLLHHTATAFPSDLLTLPGPDVLDDVFRDSDRSPTVLRNLGTLYNTGRLAGTGYVSILPVDQGIEHSAAASFAKFPAYFDPARLCDLAIAADCNAIATTLGGLGIGRHLLNAAQHGLRLRQGIGVHAVPAPDDGARVRRCRHVRQQGVQLGGRHAARQHRPAAVAVT